MSATIKSPQTKQASTSLEYCIMAPISVQSNHDHYVLLLDLRKILPLMRNGTLVVTVKKFRDFLRQERIWRVFDDANAPTSVEKISYEGGFTEVAVIVDFAGEVHPFEFQYESKYIQFFFSLIEHSCCY